MSNYIKAVDFSIKDVLLTGDSNKRIRGTEIDDEFDAIAVAIGTKADLASPVFTGTPTAPTAPTGTNNTQLATTAFVQANGVPLGGIIMWSGLIVNIPSGWQLCDGTNSTPNLRDRFVLGAGSTYAVGATGGSANATLVSHSHSVGAVGDHAHTFPVLQSQWGAATSNTTGGANAQVGTVTTSGAGGHSHSISTEGSSATNANLPPYYALAFIQRIS